MNSRKASTTSLSSKAGKDVLEVVPQPGGVDSLISTLDTSSIDELDPSLADGYRAIYDRETPVELRVQEGADIPQQVGTLEALKVKILIIGDDNSPSSVKVELSCESDLFFHFSHMCDEALFKTLQDQQKLMIEFPDYPNVLIRMLNCCIKEPHSHLAVLVMKQDGQARLDFIQNMEYKFVELLSANFNRSPEDVVQKMITYRYNSVKSRLQLMQNRLQEVNNIVKVKNPSLLLQLQKSAPATPPGKFIFRTSS